MNTHGRSVPALVCFGAVLFIGGCMESSAPIKPTPLSAVGEAAQVGQHGPAGSMAAHGAHDKGDKGYIDGWFNGDTVQLHYTKMFFCEEPPESGADSHCEVGADAEIAPRPGPIPTIYAIAAVGGIQPDISTLACPAGSVCLNHPAMIDVSRLRGPAFANAPGLPHSHIVARHHGGWHNTVNIRVSNLGVWNQIAAAKSLAKVRELQADPEVGGRGLISQDTPTNIFFFIASWKH